MTDEPTYTPLPDGRWSWKIGTQQGEADTREAAEDEVEWLLTQARLPSPPGVTTQ